MCLENNASFSQKALCFSKYKLPFMYVYSSNDPIPRGLLLTRRDVSRTKLAASHSLYWLWLRQTQDRPIRRGRVRSCPVRFCFLSEVSTYSRWFGRRETANRRWFERRNPTCYIIQGETITIRRLRLTFSTALRHVNI